MGRNRSNTSVSTPYYNKSKQVLLSRHLKKQSVVCNTEDAVHTSVVPRNFSLQFKQVKTLHDVFITGLKCSEHSPCFGSRSSVDDPLQWMSYKEVDVQIQAFGSAVVSSITRTEGSDSFVGIYSRNCPEWVITQQACSAFGLVYVPLYDTLGEEAIKHILTQVEPQVVLCYSTKEALAILDQQSSTINYIVLVKPSDNMEQLKQNSQHSIKIVLFSEFIELGKKNICPKSPSAPEATCTICYTSGSTGIPKGVIIRQEQFAASLMCVVDNFIGQFGKSEMVHLSYLPLAHILEQLTFSLLLLYGGSCGFLTGGVDTLIADMQAVQPTFLVAVPRVLGKFRTEYYKKVPNIKCIRRCLERCIDSRIADQAKGKFGSSSLISKFFFRKFRAMLGDRLMFVVSGGAPLNAEVCRFTRAAMDCPIFEGYGLTETAGVLCTTLLGESEYNIVGAVAHGIEIKLADVPDMGISVARDGIGEIRVRGVNISSGYYKDPKNTADLFDSDGWMCVGDIGQWTSTNALRIVDRCKNMFKLMQGEYVAPEKVEGIYQCSPIVLNVMLDGDSTRTFAVVIVVVDFPALRSALDSSGVEVIGKKGLAVSQAITDEQLCSDLGVRRHVLNELNILAKEKKLKGFEMAKSIHITHDPFTVQNGLLTPTMKVARYAARQAYKDVVRQLYEEGEL